MAKARAKRRKADGPPKEPAAVWVRVADLVPWDKNPKVHEPGQVERICDSIRTTAEDAAREAGRDEVRLLDGWGAALTARVADKSIVAGHGRVLAAERLGIEWIPVRFLDISERQARRLNRADNRIAELAPWDHLLLGPQLADDLKTDGPDALLAQGWAEADFEAIISPPALPEPEPPPEVKVKKIETSQLKAEFWLTVRGPIPAQPDVLEKLTAALGELEGVSVDVGMVK